MKLKKISILFILLPLCIFFTAWASGQSRYDQIVEMIQRSEQMKAAAEAKASNLADKLVP